jgi:DNA polymerase-3 subunit epsilon
VTKITGISDQMAQRGVHPDAAWRELLHVASHLPHRPTPTIAHFARFEAPFLDAIAGGRAPLDLVCTREIARRLLPDLPRCGLRALAGYFGHGVGALRRSHEHVEATSFVWRELVALLADEGIWTWNALRWWLATPRRATARARKAWPMPRHLRLAVPNAPGVYRMLRKNGDVLYVGKAASLRHRVNSYFTKQHDVHERTLEMLSQSRGLSFEIVPGALEAALLEADEIKRCRPPYNIALTGEGREVWFTSLDFLERCRRATSQCSLGPFAATEVLDQLTALARGSPEALGRDPEVKRVYLGESFSLRV